MNIEEILGNMFEPQWEYEYTKPVLDKDDFVKLAKAFTDFHNYFNELDNLKRKLARKYNQETDFLGCDYFSGNLNGAILDLLGSDYEYWLYDCEGNYDTFNKSVTLADGTHPNVKSLEDLWKFSKAQ